jgi:hypothetical protein
LRISGPHTFRRHSFPVGSTEGEDSPYPTGDNDRAAAEPGKDRTLIGILETFPQPERHFLKTARPKDNPIAIFRLRQIPASICPADRAHLRAGERAEGDTA